MTAVHIAGPPQMGGLYQTCSRCGYVLQDYTGGQVMVPEDQADRGIGIWSVGKRVAVNGDASWRVPDDAPLDDGETECRAAS